jgi:hypothetical protein
MKLTLAALTISALLSAGSCFAQSTGWRISEVTSAQGSAPTLAAELSGAKGLPIVKIRLVRKSDGAETHYRVTAAGAMREVRQTWTAGDSISISSPDDIRRRCASLNDDSILRNETKSQPVCAEYAWGGAGRIWKIEARIVSGLNLPGFSDNSPKREVDIELESVEPPFAQGVYRVSDPAAMKTVEHSWRHGDWISARDPDSAHTCKGMDSDAVVRNRRTEQWVCAK